MSTPPPMAGAPAGDADADAWRSAVLEPLLRGIAHALANRATALDGLAAELEESPSAGALAADLHAEVARLLAVHRDLRALLPDGAGEEPLDLRDVAQEAAAVAAYWPAGSPTVPRVTGEAPAVRVVRSAAVRVVVAMLVHAGHGAPALVLGGDDAVATLRVAGGEPPDRPQDAGPSWRAQVAAQARDLGGTITWGSGGAELRLPTLRALRARPAPPVPPGGQAT